MKKRTIGAVEEVTILMAGITVAARIDSGAATSSLDVRELSIKGQTIEFTLPERCGSSRHILPLKGWKLVSSASGQSRRPAVDIEICLAGQKIPTTVTLVDRSQLEYPFLVGRNTLIEGGFIVDVNLARTTPPGCSEGARP